jgi:hypothetical protein
LNERSQTAGVAGMLPRPGYSRLWLDDLVGENIKIRGARRRLVPSHSRIRKPGTVHRSVAGQKPMDLDGGQFDHFEDDFGGDRHTRFVVAPPFDGDADESGDRNVPGVAEAV